MKPIRPNQRRIGSVYIAVMGTALLVSLLALSAIALQRIQNRMLTSAKDIRQAQLNAEAAVDLGLLTMKQNDAWRTANVNGSWFSGRATGSGTCSLTVTDPVDANLSDNATEPVKVLGIGYSGSAEQRVEVIVDPLAEPLKCLYSSAAVGDAISLNSAVLRATRSGLVTANSTSATSSTLYGKVQAITISGATYSGTTTQVTASDRPEMPDWTTLFATYRTAGTEIPVANLPTRSANHARNISFNSSYALWDDDPPGLPDADFVGPDSYVGHTSCIRVDRTDKRAGAGNRLAAGLLKPNTSYQLSVEVYPNLPFLATNRFKFFLITEYADGSYVESAGSTTQLSYLNGWTTLTATATTPNWVSHPVAVYAVVNSDHASGSSQSFYIDNIDVYESGPRFISQKALGAGVNQLYSGAPTNANGIYWINCGGNKLVIERARIKGTLVLSNLGNGSCIDYGPIQMSPNTAGYPVLLVEGNFIVKSTNRTLGETENSSSYEGLSTNYNPAGMSYDFGSASISTTNATNTDIFDSEIQGLVAVSGSLTFQNYPLVRGQIVVGDDLSATSGALEIYYLPNSLLNPPPGFTADSSYFRRAGSMRKMIIP